MFTEKYIKMCEMADELQKEHKIHWENDYYYFPTEHGCFICEKFPYCKNPEYTETFKAFWIPRLDQLIKYVKPDNKTDCRRLSIIYQEGKWIAKIGHFGYNYGDSPEEAVLKLLMKEKYNKVWNEEVERWEE